jgi:hypothetical protein
LHSFPTRPTWLLLAALVFTSCNAYGPKPTPAQSPTPKPTVQPEATVGPLSKISVDKLGLSLMTPSTWKPPVDLSENSVVISPDGSNDTSITAGPFLLIIVADSKFFHSKLSFREGITDPEEQLKAMVTAMNIDAPSVDPVIPYLGAQYPAAIVRTYERNSQRTIVLMKAGTDRWLYLGAQAPESYFKYYEEAVFKPAANSITLNP